MDVSSGARPYTLAGLLEQAALSEGEIIAIVITNAPLIGRGQSPSTSSSAPSHLKTLVHLLYPILVFKPGIGASRLLVVLITPCS